MSGLLCLSCAMPIAEGFECAECYAARWPGSAQAAAMRMHDAVKTAWTKRAAVEEMAGRDPAGAVRESMPHVDRVLDENSDATRFELARKESGT